MICVLCYHEHERPDYCGVGHCGCVTLVGPTERGNDSAALERELKELHGWKESAMKVLDDLKLQEIGTLLKLPLGSNIAEHVLPSLATLQHRLEQAEGLPTKWRKWAKVAREKAPSFELQAAGWEQAADELEAALSHSPASPAAKGEK